MRTLKKKTINKTIDFFSSNDNNRTSTLLEGIINIIFQEIRSTVRKYKYYLNNNKNKQTKRNKYKIV